MEFGACFQLLGVQCPSDSTQACGTRAVGSSPSGTMFRRAPFRVLRLLLLLTCVVRRGPVQVVRDAAHRHGVEVTLVDHRKGHNLEWRDRAKGTTWGGGKGVPKAVPCAIGQTKGSQVATMSPLVIDRKGVVGRARCCSRAVNIRTSKRLSKRYYSSTPSLTGPGDHVASHAAAYW